MENNGISRHADRWHFWIRSAFLGVVVGLTLDVLLRPFVVMLFAAAVPQ